MDAGTLIALLKLNESGNVKGEVCPQQPGLLEGMKDEGRKRRRGHFSSYTSKTPLLRYANV